MKFLTIIFLFISTLVFSQNKKPNIVFLLVDDLGYGDFSCYGAKFNETSNIDKLAQSGMKFTKNYSASKSVGQMIFDALQDLYQRL